MELQDVGTTVEKQLQGKVDFKLARKIKKLDDETTYNINTCIMTVLDNEFVFKILCLICKNKMTHCTISNSAYKVS